MVVICRKMIHLINISEHSIDFREDKVLDPLIGSSVENFRVKKVHKPTILDAISKSTNLLIGGGLHYYFSLLNRINVTKDCLRGNPQWKQYHAKNFRE